MTLTIETRIKERCVCPMPRKMKRRPAARRIISRGAMSFAFTLMGQWRLLFAAEGDYEHVAEGGPRRVQWPYRVTP